MRRVARASAARRTVPLLAGLALLSAAMCDARASTAPSFDLAPALTLGATDNPFGLSTNAATQRWVALCAFNATARMQLTQALSSQSFRYGFHLNRFFQAAGASNTGHDIAATTTFNPSARTDITAGVIASMFNFSAITPVDPSVPNVTSTPVGLGSTSILTVGVTEAATYRPDGRNTLTESLAAAYLRPLSSLNVVPRTLQFGTTLRAERTMGQSVGTLTVIANDLLRLKDPIASPTTAAPYASDQVVTGQVLAGWHREVSPSTSVDLQGGALALFDLTGPLLGVGPAGSASVSYRLLPWYATLNVRQEPTVNPYVGEALIADAINLHLSLPLNRTETLLVSGLGGYTYARRVTRDHHLLNAPRVYDFFSLGGSMSYRFRSLPIALSAEYTAVTQRGSTGEGIYYPSNLRRYAGVTISGIFARGQAAEAQEN